MTCPNLNGVEDLTRTEADVQQFSQRAFEMGLRVLIDGFIAIAHDGNS